MDLSNICTNCFKLNNGETVCPFCGQIGSPAPCEIHHLSPGVILQNRYLIGKAIGSGGFGVVYKSLDLILGRIVALKEFFPVNLVCRAPGELNVSIYSGDKFEEYNKHLSRFLEEAQNMATFMNDNNIVNVFDYFTENRTAYIVMEYLNGVSLEEYIKNNGGKLSVKESVKIIESVLLGLRTLHSKSIIHRDINPKNIFITVDNKIKIIDFGTAKFCDENESTRINVVSDGYAPPEQYKTRSTEAPYTDIYAVGATLYRAITGEVPVPVLERTMESDNLINPKNKIDGVPEYIDVAIMKALALKPKLRFQSVDELLNAVRDPNPKILYPEVEEKRRVTRRNILVLSALVVLILSFTAILFATQKKDLLYEAVKSDILPIETIHAYIPYDDKDELESLKNMYDNLSKTFNAYAKKQFGKDIKVKTEFVLSKDYASTINSQSETDDSVCLFRSDVSDKLEVERENLKLISDNIVNEVHFLDKYNEFYAPEYKSIPLGFDVYILFSNKADKKGLSDVDTWDQFIKKDTKSNLLVTSVSCVDIIYSSLKNEDANLTLSSNVFKRIPYKGKLLDKKSALNSFLNGETTFYIGSCSDFKKIRNSDLSITYDCKNIFSNQNKWYGNFCQEWSISSNLNSSKKAASMLFLRYCLSDEAQQILFIDNELSEVELSVNKNVFSYQIEYNSALNILPENTGNIILYSSSSEESVFENKFPNKTSEIDKYVKSGFKATN